MALIQVAYDVPDEIFAGLVTGDLTRFGSVVRDSKEIIAHLKEVSLPEPDQAADAAGLAAALKSPRVLIGLGVAVVVVAGAGLAIWAANRKKAPAEIEPSRPVDEYNAALADYLESIKEGRLDAETLDRLIAAIDVIRQEAADGSLTIEFAPEQAEALIELVADYARRLAAANSVEVDEPDERVDANPVVVLHDWLKAQRDTLDSAA